MTGRAAPGLRAMRLALFALLILAPGPPAAAQQGGWRVIEAPQAQDGGDGAAGLPASRAAMLRDLSGAIGAVHFFTVLCEGRDNQYWRERMIALVEAEASERALRAAMIEAFNDQYRQRESAFPACSPEARAARREAAGRGEALSRALADRYR